MAGMTLREEIAMAVEIGFTEAGGRVNIDRQEIVHGDQVTGEVTLLEVDGYDEPIVVYADDVRVPDCFPPEIRTAILADVLAILADLADSFTEPEVW